MSRGRLLRRAARSRATQRQTAVARATPIRVHAPYHGASALQVRPPPARTMVAAAAAERVAASAEARRLNTMQMKAMLPASSAICACSSLPGPAHPVPVARQQGRHVDGVRVETMSNTISVSEQKEPSYALQKAVVESRASR